VSSRLIHVPSSRRRILFLDESAEARRARRRGRFRPAAPAYLTTRRDTPAARRGPRQGGSSGLEHVAFGRARERHTRVLLDEQDGEAVGGKTRDDVEDLAHEQWRQPERRLVEHEQARTRRD
jgi:hypothetical protein